MVPSDLEVMELDEDPATEPDPLANWRTPYFDYLLHEKLPTDKTEARWLARSLSPLSLLRVHSIGETTPGSYSAASPSSKGSSC